nr:glycosyltransferase family 4 protein [Bacteroidia bacterium]
KVLPEPASSAAGSRMLQVIDVFREGGWNIEMASVAKPSTYSVDLKTLGIPFHAIELNEPSFDAFIAEAKPDAVLFDRFMTEEQFGWRVAEHCPKALRILDTEDLHGLRAAREAAVKENRKFVPPDLFNPTAFREIASILRSDVSLIISEFEMKLLQDFFNVRTSQLFYLPFLLDPSELKPLEQSPSFHERQHFISIGNFLHEPNLDAVKYLHKTIWPGIRKLLPHVELHVYGAYVPESITQLHSEANGFIIKGRAHEAREVILSARVLLAPLRFGAGLKGKLLEAMLCATPSMSSSIGAEGMKGEGAWPGSIADGEHIFIREAVELYQNEKKWMQASEQCGPTLLQFKRENFSGAFLSLLEACINNLTEHRSENFTGALLQQQQFNSSKYMSLWIEAKKKLS